MIDPIIANKKSPPFLEEFFDGFYKAFSEPRLDVCIELDTRSHSITDIDALDEGSTTLDTCRTCRLHRLEEKFYIFFEL